MQPRILPLLVGLAAATMVASPTGPIAPFAPAPPAPPMTVRRPEVFLEGERLYDADAEERPRRRHKRTPSAARMRAKAARQARKRARR